MRPCKACGRGTVRLVFITFPQGAGRLPEEEVGPYGRDCARQVREGLRKLGVPYRARHARA